MKKLNNFIKTKNIFFIVILLVIIMLIGVVLNYIHNQNVEYQQLSEESMMEEQAATIIEENIPAEKESPEPEEQTTGTVETEFRDSTIMIF
jgi:regulatory protein YycI of two-component signal transduction system YycFG